MDQTRVNTECRWSDNRAGSLDLTRPEDRDHLRVDVKIAGELALRMADLRFRNRPVEARPIFEKCMAALSDSIIRRHGVTKADLDTAARARVWWVDIAAVFLPLAVLVAFAMDRVVRRVAGAFDSDDRGMAALSVALLTPVVAAIGLGVTQFWAFSVEAWLLRNGHVSFRASQIPAVHHGWIGFVAALAICAVTATLRFRATPLTGSNDSYAARRARRV